MSSGRRPRLLLLALVLATLLPCAHAWRQIARYAAIRELPVTLVACEAKDQHPPLETLRLPPGSPAVAGDGYLTPVPGGRALLADPETGRVFLLDRDGRDAAKLTAHGDVEVLQRVLAARLEPDGRLRLDDPLRACFFRLDAPWP